MPALKQTAIVIVVGLTLSACSSIIPHRAPSCDGYSRRPLNKSLWDWEAGKETQPHLEAPIGTPARPLVRKAEQVPTSAFAATEIKRSPEPVSAAAVNPAVMAPPKPAASQSDPVLTMPASLQPIPGALAPLPAGQMRRSALPANMSVAASYNACGEG